LEQLGGVAADYRVGYRGHGGVAATDRLQARVLLPEQIQ
jgi:hypothetical protein